jgi:hypothetical protein
MGLFRRPVNRRSGRIGGGGLGEVARLINDVLGARQEPAMSHGFPSGLARVDERELKAEQFSAASQGLVKVHA